MFHRAIARGGRPQSKVANSNGIGRYLRQHVLVTLPAQFKRCFLSLEINGASAATARDVCLRAHAPVALKTDTTFAMRSRTPNRWDYYESRASRRDIEFPWQALGTGATAAVASGPAGHLNMHAFSRFDVRRALDTTRQSLAVRFRARSGAESRTRARSLHCQSRSADRVRADL